MFQYFNNIFYLLSRIYSYKIEKESKQAEKKYWMISKFPENFISNVKYLFI